MPSTAEATTAAHHLRPTVADVVTMLREMDETSECKRLSISVAEPLLDEFEAMAVAEAVAACAHVQEVYLRQCLSPNHGDDEWTVRFYTKLLAPHPSLKIIYLCVNELSMNCIRCIASSLASPRIALKKLYLMENIDDEAVDVLMNALRLNGTLEELDLYTDSITIKGCQSISLYLGSSSCRLKYLDLADNGLGDNEAAVLAEGLRTNQGSMRAMWLDGNIGITHRSINVFEQAYRDHDDNISRNWRVDCGSLTGRSSLYDDWLMTTDDTVTSHERIPTIPDAKPPES